MVLEEGALLVKRPASSTFDGIEPMQARQGVPGADEPSEQAVAIEVAREESIRRRPNAAALVPIGARRRIELARRQSS